MRHDVIQLFQGQRQFQLDQVPANALEGGDRRH
jgi:hypothetical protein